MTAHVVGNRIVYTAELGRVPVGVLTGYVNEAGGFVLEHVIAFRPGVLLTMLKMGMAYAWAQGWSYILLHVPGRHPQHRGLRALARRLGFVEYAPTFWVRHQPKEVAA